MIGSVCIRENEAVKRRGCRARPYRGQLQEASNERGLPDDVVLWQPPDLSVSDHIHRLDTRNRSPRRAERSESLTCPQPGALSLCDPVRRCCPGLRSFLADRERLYRAACDASLLVPRRWKQSRNDENLADRISLLSRLTPSFPTYVYCLDRATSAIRSERSALHTRVQSQSRRTALSPTMRQLSFRQHTFQGTETMGIIKSRSQPYRHRCSLTAQSN